MACNDAGASEQAIAQLCHDYWAPIYSFIRQRGHERADAQDLTQGFFIYLLEREAYARIDRSKGKFRSFLLGWLRNFLSSARRHERRQKRGGDEHFILVDAEVQELEMISAGAMALGAPLDEERFFDWQWAGAVVERALKRLIAEQKGERKLRVFSELEPFLRGGTEVPTQEESAARLAMPVETLRSHLSRLRSRYRELLREEIVRTVASGADIDEELRYLCRILISISGGKG
jgi:RNA polymerase sigma factor (sigma-70 family)